MMSIRPKMKNIYIIFHKEMAGYPDDTDRVLTTAYYMMLALVESLDDPKDKSTALLVMQKLLHQPPLCTDDIHYEPSYDFIRTLIHSDPQIHRLFHRAYEIICSCRQDSNDDDEIDKYGTDLRFGALDIVSCCCPSTFSETPESENTDTK